MLDGLHDIRWEEISHAYGSAKDTPWHIRSLTSFDAGVRELALDELFGTIWHQGTVYEATSYAVPFLILLLIHPKTEDKEGILHLLSACATGTPAFSANDTWYKELCEKEGKDFDLKVRTATEAVAKAYHAVSVGYAHYISLLASKNKKVRLATVELLCTLMEGAQQTLSALERTIHAEPDKPTKARMIEKVVDYLLANKLFTAEDLAGFRSTLGVQANWIPYTSNIHERMVQFAAAIGYMKLPRPVGDEEFWTEQENEIVHSLVRTIEKPNGLHPFWRKDPLGAESVTEQAVDVLCQLDSHKSTPLLSEALKVTHNPELAHLIAISLLSTVLLREPLKVSYHGKPLLQNGTMWYGYVETEIPPDKRTRIYPQVLQEQSVSELAILQKQALLAVLATPAVWRLKSNLLEAFGLSPDRKQLQAELAQHLAI